MRFTILTSGPTRASSPEQNRTLTLAEAIPALIVFFTLVALSGFLAWISVRHDSFFAGMFSVVAFLIALVPAIPGVTIG